MALVLMLGTSGCMSTPWKRGHSSAQTSIEKQPTINLDTVFPCRATEASLPLELSWETVEAGTFACTSGVRVRVRVRVKSQQRRDVVCFIVIKYVFEGMIL
jgi:hypothetical protein